MDTPPSVRPGDFGDALSCYTAALAVWLAQRRTHWWRPLLAGGPTLAVAPTSTGLMRFEHHPRPLLPALGLTVREADTGADACAGVAAELASNGAVVVCGDVYNLPWQRGFGRWHAPHWFTIVRRESGTVVDDPLAMATPAGPQRPVVVPVDDARAGEWLPGPPRYPDAHLLREVGMVGADMPAVGARYRWLTVGGGTTTARRRGPEWLIGADAVTALAERFGAVGDDDPIHEQADDLWQALRQRELVLAASELDTELVPAAGRVHWRRAVERWRRIPVLLTHSRVRAAAGLPTEPARMTNALREVAAFEDRWLVGAAADPGREG